MFIIYQSCVASAVFGLYYPRINAALKEQTIKPTDHFCQFQVCSLAQPQCYFYKYQISNSTQTTRLALNKSLQLILFPAHYSFTLFSPGCIPLLRLNPLHFSKPVLPDEFRDGL